MNTLQNILCSSTFLFLYSASFGVNAQLSAIEVAEKVAHRAANEGRVGNMHFTMSNDTGGIRKRSALMIHIEEQSDIKIGIYFTSPAAIQNTGFLSHDYVEGSDQNWLYLPVTDRVRKLPASSRGDYFMGTDLTYGDIKDNFKFALDDWDFSLGEDKIIDEKRYFSLRGVIKDEQRKQELGYASFDSVIDPDTLFPVQIHYTDADNEPLKHTSILQQEKVGNAWTAIHFVVVNLQSAHKTEIVFTDMRYMANLPKGLLSPDELGYGTPIILGL
ncbi:MAG: hypothetical protein ACI9J5_002282 [Paraglaciecola sp.]|jgi:hypothetical protein